MKTAIVTKYGSPEVIQIIETQKPIPKPDEILVKIKAFGVTSGDVRIRSANFPKGFTIPGKLALGIFGPRNKVLGSEFSGVVEKVGDNVKDFAALDRVMGFRVFNIYAEYVCLKTTDAIVKMPENIGFTEAASVPFGACTALYFLKMASLKPNQIVLINGASGSVGSNAVQMAKNLGARVVAVCSNKNHELVKSLGADEVIDYRNTDLKTIEKVDVIFDTVGNLKFEDHEHLLNSGGIFLQAVATFGELFAKKNRADNKKFLTGTAPEKQEDLAKIREMLLEGKLKPMVDQIFNFDGIQKAHQYVETGHKKGGVVVKIED